VDALTQLANRRQFMEATDREVATARRHGRPLAAVMVDIDRFKQVNDTWGHQVGDDVIRAVAARLRLHSREVDLAGRYGGEEFALVLPDVGDAAGAIAERLRTEVAGAPVETAAGPVPVTISLGVAYLQATDTGAAPLLARADECLYRAKRGGRNRVVVHPSRVAN
jgi:diguanylate cyclase (GGDEF)-like protein